MIQKTDGTFVVFVVHQKASEPVTYATTTTASQDAHDFGSDRAAREWMRLHGFTGGKVRQLTPEGFWPEL